MHQAHHLRQVTKLTQSVLDIYSFISACGRSRPPCTHDVTTISQLYTHASCSHRQPHNRRLNNPPVPRKPRLPSQVDGVPTSGRLQQLLPPLQCSKPALLTLAPLPLAPRQS